MTPCGCRVLAVLCSVPPSGAGGAQARAQQSPGSGRLLCQLSGARFVLNIFLLLFTLCNFIFQWNCIHFKFCTLAFCHLLELGCQHLALPVNVLVAGEKEERDQESCGKCCMNHMAVLPSSQGFAFCGSWKFTMSYPCSEQFISFCLFVFKERRS